MNAIEVLKSQHRDIETLLRQARASKGPEQVRVLGQAAESLMLHILVEERHIHPLLRRHGLDNAIPTSREEHQAMKALVGELLELKRTDPNLLATIQRLERLTLSHVTVEEKQLFPAIEARVDAGLLESLANDLARSSADLGKEELLKLAAPQEEAAGIP